MPEPIVELGKNRTFKKGKYMLTKFMGLALLVIFPLRALAHGNHGSPGALPPPLHGGVVQEAEHKGVDAHAHGKEGEEVELFFEAVYKDKELSVYPLTYAQGSTASFVAFPHKDLSGVTLKAENPRTKKVETLKTTVADDAIKAAFDSKNANRFIVHVTAKHANEEKVAKIQIEKK